MHFQLQKYRSKIKESNSTNALMTTHSDADRLSMHSTSRKDDSCSETTHGGSSRESSRPPSFCHERLDEHANERTDNSGYFTNVGVVNKK
jgi:hypothetical protein